MIEALLDPFGYAFFVKGVIVATLAGGLCGLIGVYITLRGMSYIGHGLSHAIFGGFAASSIISVNYYLGAGVWGLASALAINRVTRSRRIGADAAIGLEHPVLTAVLQTQRVDTARSAADQHAIADNRGIGGRGVVAVEAEGPFQFQAGGLRRREPWLRLKPIGGRRHAPGVPVRRGRAHGARAFATRSTGGGGRLQ